MDDPTHIRIMELLEQIAGAKQDIIKLYRLNLEKVETDNCHLRQGSENLYTQLENLKRENIALRKTVVDKLGNFEIRCDDCTRERGITFYFSLKLATDTATEYICSTCKKQITILRR